MIDIEKTIAYNILKELKKQNKTKEEMATFLNTSIEDVNKILNGSKFINRFELHDILKFLNITSVELLTVPEDYSEDNLYKLYAGRLDKKTIEFLDELSDEILFHNKVYENGLKGMEPIENQK